MLGTSASQIIEQSKTPNTDIFVINPTDPLHIGGDIEKGDQGIKEDLMRSSPELYKSLTYLKTTTQEPIVDDKNIITITDAHIYRKDSKDKYEIIPKDNQPLVKFLTVSYLPEFKLKSNYFKSILEKIKQLIAIDKTKTKILILDPIELCVTMSLYYIKKVYENMLNEFIDIDLTIIFVDSGESSQEEIIYIGFCKHITTYITSKYRLVKIENEWIINEPTIIGGNLDNSKFKLHKSKSTKSKSPKYKKNNKNTKKNNSRKKKSKKNNISRNKSKLSKRN